jgi:prepilin-type processing-associated H-X9-DG protein
MAQAIGSSYRFAPEAFSQFPSTTAPFPNFKKYFVVDPKEGKLGLPGGPYNDEPPFPLPLSFFARPTDTRILRCFTSYWDDIDYRKQGRVFHPNGNMLAFLDGHVKWVSSKSQLDSYCDGPTWSPKHTLGQPGYDGKGDGSCSSTGMEREEK